MRRAIARGLAAMAAWSVFVLGLLMFYPGRIPFVPCSRPVGTPESRAACQPIIDAANEQVWMFQTLPLLVTIAAGYLVIIVLEARRYRRGGRAKPELGGNG